MRAAAWSYAMPASRRTGTGTWDRTGAGSRSGTWDRTGAGQRTGCPTGMRNGTGRARGFTLVELIVSIAIIATAAVAVLGVLSSVATGSAQSAVQAQATQIASAYLNEVLVRSFSDPDASPIEPTRDQFDDVGDYNGLVNVGVRDQYNSPVAGLGQYNVAVQVTTPPAGSLGAVSLTEMRLVTVTVVHTTGVKVVLSGYRTAYP